MEDIPEASGKMQSIVTTTIGEKFFLYSFADNRFTPGNIMMNIPAIHTVAVSIFLYQLLANQRTIITAVITMYQISLDSNLFGIVLNKASTLVFCSCVSSSGLKYLGSIHAEKIVKIRPAGTPNNAHWKNVIGVPETTSLRSMIATFTELEHGRKRPPVKAPTVIAIIIPAARRLVPGSGLPRAASTLVTTASTTI